MKATTESEKTTGSIGRVSVSLTGKAATAVQDLGERFDLTEGAVVRRAIGLLQAVMEEQDSGNKLMIQGESGSPQEIKLIFGY